MITMKCDNRKHCLYFTNKHPVKAVNDSTCSCYAPAPVGEAGALGGHRHPSSVRPSVCLMSRTSALTRKPKGLGRRNFAQGYTRSHATPTPTSRSKGQVKVTGRRHIVASTKRAATWRTAADITSLKYYLIQSNHFRVNSAV